MAQWVAVAWYDLNYLIYERTCHCVTSASYALSDENELISGSVDGSVVVWQGCNKVCFSNDFKFRYCIVYSTTYMYFFIVQFQIKKLM